MKQLSTLKVGGRCSSTINSLCGCLHGLYVPDWQFEVPTINFHGTSLNNGSELFIDRFVDLSGILTSSSMVVFILVGCENMCVPY